MAQELTASPNVVRARAAVVDERRLIPQPHGGALRPFTPATGAAAGRSSVKAIRREALGLLTAGTPEAAQRLLALMASPDERVAVIACQQVMDRALGKPTEAPQAADDGAQRGPIDMRLLSADERAEMAAALEIVARLAELVRNRAAAEPAP